MIARSSLLLLLACSFSEPKEGAVAKKDPGARTEEPLVDLWDVTDSGSAAPEEDLPLEPTRDLPDEQGRGKEEALKREEEVKSSQNKKRRKRSSVDNCLLGEMRFEGGCVDKTRVDEILRSRHQKAVKQVQEADAPDKVAKAQGDLIDQQIVQVEKAEDDLDEIIEHLKKENSDGGSDLDELL